MCMRYGQFQTFPRIFKILIIWWKPHITYIYIFPFPPRTTKYIFNEKETGRTSVWSQFFNWYCISGPYFRTALLWRCRRVLPHPGKHAWRSYPLNNERREEHVLIIQSALSVITPHSWANGLDTPPLSPS